MGIETDPMWATSFVDKSFYFLKAGVSRSGPIFQLRLQLCHSIKAKRIKNF